MSDEPIGFAQFKRECEFILALRREQRREQRLAVAVATICLALVAVAWVALVLVCGQTHS